jgi:methyltransferase family protein
VAELEARHLAELTFPEVSRALRALSSAYVERRAKLASGAALSGAGKRAAFALFYGPLHFLLIRHIVSTLPGAAAPAPALVDLGCGTGAAGAAWASVMPGSIVRVLGVDRHPWALAQATITYSAFGVPASVRRADAAAVKFPAGPAATVAAFTVNELDDSARRALLTRLFDGRRRQDRILIVEPLARSVAPWWNEWRDAFARHGGRADEWRVRTELPAIVAKLDRAAGLDHRELTGRSLWLST